MALLVEDGTGVASADSYVSRTNADTFWTNRGGSDATAWAAASTADRDGALRFAAIYLDGAYAWRGAQLYAPDSGQGLRWPRGGAYDSEGWLLSGVPPRVVDAQCLVALWHLRSAITAAAKRGGGVAEVEIAGAVRERYFDGASPEQAFPFLAQLLAGLHNGRRGSGGPKDTRR